MRLRDAFPDGEFQPPASEDAIARAEADLALVLPPPLKALYREANGFREATGYAQYLMPLDELVRGTRFLWSDFAGDVPDVAFPDFRPFVFFGSSASDYWWGIRIAPPHDLVAWHHNLLDEDFDFETPGLDIIAVFQADQALYDGQSEP